MAGSSSSASDGDTVYIVAGAFFGAVLLCMVLLGVCIGKGSKDVEVVEDPPLPPPLHLAEDGRAAV